MRSPPPGKANLSMSTAQLAERFGAVSMTLEMPFKDNAELPDPVYGWSPERCRLLARSCLDALHAVIDRIAELSRPGQPMPRLVLIRHGQSAWNLENRFTGWWDVDLTDAGRGGGAAGRRAARRQGASTSTSASPACRRGRSRRCTSRSRRWAGCGCRWRSTGGSTSAIMAGSPGSTRRETAARHGDEQVHIWRRSFDIPPPALEPGGEFDLASDRRYAGVAVPATESLKDTIARVLPYWEERIAPALRAGERVLISAHGNSLRALVKHLSNIPDEEITGLEIPTGQPIVYELDEELDAIERYYLKDR